MLPPDQQQEQQPNDESSSLNISCTSISESQAEKDQKKFSCLNCDKVYTTKKSLKRHVKQKHQISNTTVAQNKQDGVIEEQLNKNEIDATYPASQKVCRNLPINRHIFLCYFIQKLIFKYCHNLIFKKI